MTKKITLLLMLVTACSLPILAQSQLDNILSPSRLPFLKNSRLIQLSSGDTSGGNNDFIAIPAGKTAVIADIQGPGVVVNIWVTIASPDKYFLRRIVLRMYWDGEQTPSVEVPIGDFFGTGFQYKHYVTPYLGMSSGGYYCYFPMPFNASARIEVENQTGQEVTSFYYHIDYQQLSRPLEPDVACFHAAWHREPRTDPKKPYLVLSATGQGHLVGVNMSMQSYDNDMQYLEGDEQVYVDGEKRPSLSGTGTEDYFNSGWYFNKGEFAAPYHGLMLKDDSLGRIAAYRFHILDAIPFTKSLRFAIEHGDQNAEVADYSSTAYWYQKEPHAPLAPIGPPGSRIPLRVVVPNGALEAESLTPSGTTAKNAVEEMTAYGAEWSGARQLRVESKKAGEEFTLSLPVEEEQYDVSLFYTRGPEYGTVAVFHDDGKVATLNGYSAGTEHGGKVVLRGLKSSSATVKLRFVVEGKDAKSNGYVAGIDAFVLQPHRVFIPEWWLIGPFPNPRNEKLQRLGLDVVYPPEHEIDLTKTYTGVDQKPIRWVLTKTPDKGRMDLYQFDPYEMVVVYALTYVYSPEDQTLPLLIGSDDGIKVFVNGSEIHRFLAIRVARPDQDRIPLSLKKGWNSLMLKIENNYGGYNYYARVIDPGHTLVFSPQRERK